MNRFEKAVLSAVAQKSLNMATEFVAKKLEPTPIPGVTPETVLTLTPEQILISSYQHILLTLSNAISEELKSFNEEVSH